MCCKISTARVYLSQNALIVSLDRIAVGVIGPTVFRWEETILYVTKSTWQLSYVVFDFYIEVVNACR